MLYGDGGNDTLYGDAGGDVLNGGAGDDTLYGGADTDVMSGGAGNDTLNGDDGHDVLRGDDGNDTLNGGNGADTLYGDAGNDILIGGASVDVMYGGTGSDWYFVDDVADLTYDNQIRTNKRIFNNAKVSDHFAIIPTGAAPKNLSEPEQKIYDLVTKRFLAIFYPSAEYNITTRITRIEQEAFKTEGKVLVTPGWLAVYGKEAVAEDEENPNLPPLEKNERVWAKDIEVKTKAQ